jgi:TRAP-type mannitol/chloroaromatic compound transport system substrate-binding protein
MQRRSFLKQAGFGAVAGTAAVAAPVFAQTNPKISWKMTSSFTTGLPTLFGAAQLFCKMIGEATEGNFTIRAYPGGELVPALGVMDAVGNKTVECGQTASYYYYGKDPAFCFDTAVPFGLNPRQMSAWMYQGGGMKLTREMFAPRHIINFPFGNTGTQMGGWYRKEIKTIDDLKGLKMRTAGFAGEVLSRLGVVPQQIAGGDIYPSLEKGTLDAVEFVGPVDDEKLGFQKVAKYYYYPGWWEGSAQLSLYVNDEAYNSLPKHYQTLIDLATRYAGDQLLSDYDAHNPAALRRLIASGAILKAFPREVMDASFKAANTVYGEFNAKSPLFKKLYDSHMGFRDDVVPWFRVAEGSFDNYMGIALAHRKK